MKSTFNIFRAAPVSSHWPVLFPYLAGLYAISFPLYVVSGSLSENIRILSGPRTTDHGQRKRIPLLSLLLFISIINLGFSQQNVTTDIQNINLAVFDSKSLQMDLSYQVFMDDVIQSQMQGVVKKNGNLLYQQSGSVTIIKNEPYCLFIDSDKSLMVLDPYYPQENQINRNDILNLNIDSLKPHILATEMKEKGNIREYIFTLKKGQFSRVMLEFNSKTFFLHKIELHKREHYKDANGVHNLKMIIQFYHIDNKTKVLDENFDLSEYVTIDTKKKTAVANGIYKKYKFNSNIDKTVRFK